MDMNNIINKEGKSFQDFSISIRGKNPNHWVSVENVWSEYNSYKEAIKHLYKEYGKYAKQPNDYDVSIVDKNGKKVDIVKEYKRLFNKENEMVR